MRYVFALTMLGICSAAFCLAGVAPPPTPEIDGTTAGAAVALVAGGVLILRYRRKK